jgi:hypothetical protein
MITPKRNTGWLDFHPGGVPAGIIFDGQIGEVLKFVEHFPAYPGHTAEELALVGLVSFFEGFCKNHTAAVLNICPELARELNKNGREIKLSPVDVLNHAENLPTIFGCLVIEKIDLGTAKSINSLYGDLFGITPLSKRDADKFHALLEDRNVIVHHGNILTPRYSGERFIKREIGRSRIFLDSLVVSRNDVLNAVQFLHNLSIKLRKATEIALSKYVAANNLRLAKANREAIDNLHLVQPNED